MPGADPVGPSVVGILLAAGASQRFAANKLLQPLSNGVPVVVQSARHLLAALPDSIAVVSDNQSTVARLLVEMGMPIAVNPKAYCGIGSSIVRGVQESLQAKGWIVALGDMPLVPVEIITRLASRLAGERRMVAPLFQGQRGHPVGFSWHFGADLLSLSGDRGGRELFQRYPEAVEMLSVRHAGVRIDVDTPEDLAALPLG